ncbi:hypothetical protein [Virgisporangium aurantiacum]|uniref:Uncharacterized protein n=1 Tax=Virgisporangium aurantiacum TaxID=175570 RepID=A0A8J4E3L2_9ACTN|nr:hypothetical protein [Virgisporangium aurantiacum]GIJ60174.1 hypothetical protein Vau01_076900 [Virgisporangium aurantiacum]
MGASQWDYYVAYQPDLQAALDALRQHVLDTGDYWWAVPYEFGKSAADFPNRPQTEDELWAAEEVQEAGTHSILDVDRVLDTGEKPDYGTVEPVGAAEALDLIGTATLTRDHVGALWSLVRERSFGRCAVLHDEAGVPTEIFFFGYSGD